MYGDYTRFYNARAVGLCKSSLDDRSHDLIVTLCVCELEVIEPECCAFCFVRWYLQLPQPSLRRLPVFSLLRFRARAYMRT